MTTTAEASPAVLPPVPEDPELFTALLGLREEYAHRRAEVAQRRVQAETEREGARQELEELRQRLHAAEAAVRSVDGQLTAIDGGLTTLGDEERAARIDVIANILETGARRLREASTTWGARQEQAVDESLAQYERTLSEHEEMVRNGVLDKLPLLARQREEEVATEARAALRERYGDRDPLVLPVVILGSEDRDERVIAIALPLHGDATTLEPRSVGVAVAAAVCEGVQEALSALEVRVRRLRNTDAGSCALLRYELQEPPVTVAEALDLIELGAEGAADRSAPLRRARITLRCVRLPDVDDRELTAALLVAAAT